MDVFFQNQSFINTLLYQHFVDKLLALEKYKSDPTLQLRRHGGIEAILDKNAQVFI